MLQPSSRWTVWRWLPLRVRGRPRRSPTLPTSRVLRLGMQPNPPPLALLLPEKPKAGQSERPTSSLHMFVCGLSVCLCIFVNEMYRSVCQCTCVQHMGFSAILINAQTNTCTVHPPPRCHSVKGCNQSPRLTALSMLLMEGQSGQTGRISPGIVLILLTSLSPLETHLINVCCLRWSALPGSL